MRLTAVAPVSGRIWTDRVDAFRPGAMGPGAKRQCYSVGGLGEVGLARRTLSRGENSAYRPFRMARQMWNGVAGPSNAVTPSGARASSTALLIAGNSAMAPASPQPFTPSGLVVQRVALKPRSNGGRSSARGIA